MTDVLVRFTVKYKAFRDYLAEVTGIVLGDNKQYLVSSRIHHLMIKFRLDNLGAVVELMQQALQRHLRKAAVDAMTTNGPLWFRDTHPFNIFRHKLLPEFQLDQKKSVRVWSAACSSGQEPFSLSMLVDEYKRANLGAPSYSVNILATDLSLSMIDVGLAAEYHHHALCRGLTAER